MTSSWRKAAFKEFCDITRGASPRPIHDYLGAEGMPWIKIADATAESSRYITRTKEKIKLDGVRASVEVFPGDLILSNSATPGLPKFLKINACIHDGWMLLRNFRDLDIEYAYWLLLAERVKLVAQGNGSVFTNLKTDILKSHVVAVPSLKDQRQIAKLLNTLDDKITLLRETNSTLEAIAQALFKSWFIDFDPVRLKLEKRPIEGMNVDATNLFPDSFEQSELGDIPKGWVMSTVGESFVLTMGQSPPGNTYCEDENEIPFYQGRTDFGFRFPTKRIYCTSPTRIAEIGDTLVSVRAPVGDVNMAIEKCCIGRGVASVRHPKNYRSFTFYAIAGLKSHFKSFDSEGTIFGSINKINFQNLPIISPNLSVLSAYEEISRPIDSKIVENENQVRLLSSLRDNLLPRLISGQIKLPDAEQKIEAATA